LNLGVDAAFWFWYLLHSFVVRQPFQRHGKWRSVAK